MSETAYDKKVAELQKERDELKQKLKDKGREIRSVRSKAKSEARKVDARAMIIVGAFCREHAKRNHGSEVQQVVLKGILRHLEQFPKDRPLFQELLTMWGVSEPAEPAPVDAPVKAVAG